MGFSPSEIGQKISENYNVQQITVKTERWREKGIQNIMGVYGIMVGFIIT